MKFIADLHIHSRYSRATSKQLAPEEIDWWAKIKGIALVGSGDFTHPAWRAELKEKLEPAEPGLYQLKPEYKKNAQLLPPNPVPVRFVISGEISTIYKKKGRLRKLHHLILLPSLELAEGFSKKLEQIGNLASDGRPILGIDSKHLLEMVLELGDGAVLIPAHIWTPWFSLFGSRSGFDDIEECFEDLAGEIFALETGLSSDPKMNWRLSQLDKYTLVSNSDAHSPKNLAREANIFNCELDYFKIIASLKDPQKGFLGTIEFFPEEGKYHFDGHRKCRVRLSPKETIKLGGICPVCGKPLTIGVMHRVEELADREEPIKPERAPGYKSLIPLPEVIAEIMGTGAQSKKVEQEYFNLIQKLGSELEILLDKPVSEVEKEFPLLGVAVERMRQGKVIVEEGYDGEYGRIRVFEEDELKRLCSQQAEFFDFAPKKPSPKKAPAHKEEAQLLFASEEKEAPKEELFISSSALVASSAQGLSPEQIRAIQSEAKRILIKAGPGTGKTFTLTRRIAFLVESGRAKPEQILALTFTNQAGRELRERLFGLLGEQAGKIFIGTFHSFALKVLREFAGKDFSLLDELAKRALISELFPELGIRRVNQALNLLRRAKSHLLLPEDIKSNKQFPDWFFSVYKAYQSRLEKEKAMDFDDLIFKLVKMLDDESFLKRLHNHFRYIFVDEYQDLDYAQWELVRRLAGDENYLFAIGDPDQSIYGFRGASPNYFHRFKEDFPDARVLELSHSFRSSEQILKASLQVLGKERELHSGIEGIPLKIAELASENAEAEFVVYEIEKLVGGFGFFSFDSARVESSASQIQGFGDFAVLFRSSEQIPPLKEAFLRSGIPFQILSESPLESRFFQQLLWVLKIVKGEAGEAVFRLALNQIFKDELSLPKTRAELESWLEKRKEQKVARELAELIKNHSQLSAKEICAKAFSLLPCEPDEEEEKEQICELVIELVKRREKEEGIRSIEQVIELLSLASAQDFYDPRADRVALLTIHSAKGLEFEVVFLVGCEEGIIPYFTARSEQEIEEEQRLFYVALTRAKRLVYLCRAKKRNWRGRLVEHKPSRFLTAIKKELVENASLAPPKKKPKARQLELF